MSHRPTLKQSNKPFKSKHASKHAQDNNARKKFGRPGGADRSNRGARLKVTSKEERRNQAKQKARNKRAALADSRRLGGRDGAPKIVALVPLTQNANVRLARSVLLSRSPDTPAADQVGPFTARFPELKQRITFVESPRDPIAMLDALKVADIVLFVIAAEEEVDDVGSYMLTLIKAQGVPAVAGGLIGCENPTRARGMRKEWAKFLEHQFALTPKVFEVDRDDVAADALRALTTLRQQTLHWRTGRSYLVVDNLAYTQTSESDGVLSVYGYLRGNNLSADQLVHLPGRGTYQLHSIQGPEDPCPFKARRASSNKGGMAVDAEGTVAGTDGEAPVLQTASIHHETLERLHEPNELQGDQEWLRDAPDGGAQGNGQSAVVSSTTARVVAIPEGMSAYQAAWILDSDSDGDEDLIGEAGPAAAATAAAASAGLKGKTTAGASSGTQVYTLADPTGAAMVGDGFGGGGGVGNGAPSEVSMMSEFDSDDGLDAAAYDSKYENTVADARALDPTVDLAELEQEDITWPDEVHLREDQQASEYLRDFRGLRSFTHSPWDPYENLPPAYSRIFQFENINRTSRRVRENAGAGGVAESTYVRLNLTGVPLTFQTTFNPAEPLVVFSLFSHEQKVSLVHLEVQRHSSFQEPLPSGTRVIVHIGFRRYVASPLYSENNHKSDKHRVENFFHDGAVAVASLFAPIHFGQAPALIFSLPTETMPSQLIATGKLDCVNPNRLNIKRVIITGDVLRTHKKKATIHKMFYNPDDIAWFRKVELWTKFGRHGHIRKSLGTHGHMKCLFDGNVKQHDTVCMTLYKRVFPAFDTLTMCLAGIPEANPLHLQPYSENMQPVADPSVMGGGSTLFVNPQPPSLQQFAQPGFAGGSVGIPLPATTSTTTAVTADDTEMGD